MKQKQRNKARKNNKKQGRSQKETKEQGRTKKKRNRERQRVKRRSEWSQGERKGDTEKLTKITLFQGGKQCFCKQTNKKTKRKDRFRANCPKTHWQGCVDPNSRRKRRKEQNTQRREGIFKRSLFKFAKTVSKEEPRKTRKNHPHRSCKQISGNSPNRTQTATQLRAENAPKNSQIGPRPGKMGKTAFSKRPQFCSPRPFFALQNQLGQKSELPKKRIVKPPKLFSKNLCSIEATQRVQRKWTRHQNAKLLRNPLFWRVSRPTTSWTAPGRAQTRNTRKERKIFRTAKKDLDDLQNGIFQKPEKSENSEETWFPETAKNHFAL